MKKQLFFLLFIYSFVSHAQQVDTSRIETRIFQLGEVVVVNKSIDSILTISFREMEQFNRTDVSQALNLLPGITIGNIGARNESVVFVRGFDLRQVPVFLDGVPVYVPYDGYVDMGRFTTFDLSEIYVSKGFASILYGANTMGGAINLISRRPVKPLEADARIGMFSGVGYRWNVNAGSNLGKFYLQLGLSQITQSYYPLPKNFVPVQNEDGGSRENSFRDDRKFSIKAGFTPNETDEYVIGYSKQQGEKGTPPYVGHDSNTMTRFWQWPKWDKESLYLISRTKLATNNYLKTRWYFDTFVNELTSYDDASYSSMNRPYAFQSFYDDYALGGNVELEARMFKYHVLKLGVQLKNDIHRENDFRRTPAKICRQHPVCRR